VCSVTLEVYHLSVSKKYFTIMIEIEVYFQGNEILKSCKAFVNPLKPELNTSGQRCLTRFLLGILLLEQYISLIYA
jgi:hypothetical protein